MSQNTSSNRGGIGFLGLLALLFIGLKLTGYIDWSWWWVLSPLWGLVALMLALFLLGSIFLGAAYLMTSEEDRKRQRVADAAADLAARLRRR